MVMSLSSARAWELKDSTKVRLTGLNASAAAIRPHPMPLSRTSCSVTQYIRLPMLRHKNVLSANMKKTLSSFTSPVIALSGRFPAAPNHRDSPQMAKVLGVSSSSPAAYRSVLMGLGNATAGVTTSVFNRIYHDRSFKIRRSYVQDVKENLLQLRAEGPSRRPGRRRQGNQRLCLRNDPRQH